jgi:hypothetical protein
MRAVFFVADMTSASSRLRVGQYTDLLRRDVERVTLLRTYPSKYVPRPAWMPRIRCFLLFYGAMSVAAVAVQRLVQISIFVPRAQVVVLQKDLLFRSRLFVLERLLFVLARRRHIRVVFDIDDAIYLGSSLKEIPRMRSKIERIAGSSAMILAGSTAIIEELRPYNRNIAFAPTCIMLGECPERTYGQQSGAVTRLVWTGTASNAVHLTALSSVLRQLGAARPLLLEVVTRTADLPAGFLSGVDVQLTDWSEANERIALARADIALAPLTATHWTRAKCGGRLLAYFAAGLPTVASPVGAQSLMVDHGRTGLLATTHEQWLECIAAFRDSSALRQQMGVAARSYVEANRSAQTYYSRWRSLIFGSESLEGEGGAGADLLRSA